MKEYILRVVAAAIVCAIVQNLLRKETTVGRIAGLLCGIFMAITVVAPLGNVSFHGISSYWDDIAIDAAAYVQEGIAIAEKQESDIIKTQSEAYILDKANKMGLQIAVEVELDDQNGNIPCGVIINGDVAPYAQMQLESFMEEKLGIARENQKWN